MEEEKLKKAIDLLKSEISVYDTYYCLATSQALKTVLNELERLQRDNNALEMTHDYDVNMIDEVKGEYVKLSKEFKTLKNDSIPKQVIRDKFKRINETKIKIDKTNARDYMIFGNTERATGWFINIDYIEKILLDVPGYKIRG